MKKKFSIIIALLLVAIFSINVGAASFKDLNGHWAKNYIEGQSGMGLLNGYPDGTFRPNNNLTNAEAIAVINRLTKVFKENEISFTDVKPNDWFYTEYRKAVYTGFVQDKADKAYPNNFINRGEIATMLAIVYGVEPNLTANIFKDVPANNNQAGYINALNAIGVINGYPDGTFKPNQLVTRAEYSKMLNTIYTRLSNPVRYPAAYLHTDKSELNGLLMKGADYADGKSASVKDKYSLAYLNGKMVADNAKSIQAEIDLAAQRLRDAIDAVDSEKSVTADKNQRRRYRRPRRDYDDNSWTRPDYNRPDTTPSADKTELIGLINKADDLFRKVDNDYYRNEKANLYNDLLKAIKDGKYQYNDESARQDDVDAASSALRRAINAFTDDVRKEALKDKLKEVETFINDNDIIPEDADQKIIDEAKKVLEDKNASQEDVDKMVEELNDILVKYAPVKLMYGKINIQGNNAEPASFEMTKDMSYEDARDLVKVIAADGKELDNTKLVLDITPEISENLVLRDKDGEIVKFRKPSNLDKTRIKYTYEYMGKEYSGILEYRSKETGKKFKNIGGIYRILEDQAADINFFKNYEGNKAGLFDTVTGEDVSELLKVKVMKDGNDVTKEDGKYDKGEYDLIFYYMEGKEEVAFTETSTLIVDSAILTKDLVYIYTPEDASYFIPMKDKDNRIIFGINIDDPSFKELPEIARISAQDTGATFLGEYGNADIKIKFVDENDTPITSKDQLKAGMKLYAVLLDDITGDLGDRKVTFEAGEKYEVPVLTNADLNK